VPRSAEEFTPAAPVVSAVLPGLLGSDAVPALIASPGGEVPLAEIWAALAPVLGSVPAPADVGPVPAAGVTEICACGSRPVPATAVESLTVAPSAPVTVTAAAIFVTVVFASEVTVEEAIVAAVIVAVAGVTTVSSVVAALGAASDCAREAEWIAEVLMPCEIVEGPVVP
jgi:hypothetical protein